MQSRNPSSPLLCLVGLLLVGISFWASGAGAIDLVMDQSGDGMGNLLSAPHAVALDPNDDTVYVASWGPNGEGNVFKIAPDDTITLIADASGDGMGNTLGRPYDLAVAPNSGNVYVSGFGTDNVFKIDKLTGIVTQIADFNGAGGGMALFGPRGIAVSVTENVYVAGQASNNVLRIETDGSIFQIISSTGDGMGNSLTTPLDVVVDPLDNVYVTGHFTNNVFRIEPGGMITQIMDATGDGAGNALDGPWGLALGGGGLWVAGNLSDNVFFRSDQGAITQLMDSSGDGVRPLISPATVVGIPPRVGFVTGSLSDNVFRISGNGGISQLIGFNGDNQGNGLSAPWGMVIDSEESLYLGGVNTDNVFRIPSALSRSVPLLGPAGYAAATALLTAAALLRAARARRRRGARIGR